MSVLAHNQEKKRVTNEAEIKNFKQNKFLQLLLFVYALFSILLAISPTGRFDWFLENLLIVFFVSLLIFTYRYFKFSNASYFWIAVFMMLHTFGAHYNYVVPYDKWLSSLSSYPRDNFDRVVHFSFGLLISYPGFEFLRRVVSVSKIWAYVLTVLVILSMGAFYELIEMWVANIVSPGQGDIFLGLQGDPWDTQHDMSSAMYGAIIAMIITALIRTRLVEKG
ncbi:MAG: yjdF [Bacilli bacterium]|nr:yjdF [Bacilli bacterium]